jgi:nicotinamide riboside transporter PnuC
MKQNMGKTDRALRFIVAIVIGILYMNHTISGMLAGILGLLAVVFALTGFVKFCPLYLPFNIDTREDKK